MISLTRDVEIQLGKLALAAEEDPRKDTSAFARHMNGLPAERKAAIKAALAKSYEAPMGMAKDQLDALKKDATTSGLTTGTGLYPYSLRGPADNLWPVVTPIRNIVPREVLGGVADHWKRITAIDPDEDYGFVAEPTDTTANTVAGRAGFMKFTEVDDSVIFKTQGLDGYITYEQRFGGKGGEPPTDFRSDELSRLGTLQGMMMREEKADLFANVTGLGTVGAATTTGVAQLATAVGTLTAATHYYIWVTALTGSGYRKGRKGRITAGSDVSGESFGTEADIQTTAGGNAGDQSISITWAWKTGAVAYNVYVGTSTGRANCFYYATVTTNYYQITTPTPTLGTNFPNAADQTADAYAFDGYIALFNAKAGYVKQLGGATNATWTGTGGFITEWDDCFLSLFNAHPGVGPDIAYVSAADKGLINKILLGSTAPTYRLDMQPGQIGWTGGLSLGGHLNQYTNKVVQIVVHPYLMKGTVLFWTHNLGEYYPNMNIPNPVVKKLSFDYLSLEFAQTTLRQEHGVYYKGAPTIRAGFPLAIIQGAA
jgi:hypothetical protein